MLSHVSLSLQFVAINHAYRCDGIPSDIAILMKSYRFPPVCCQMFSKFSKKNGSILLPCSLLRSTLPMWWQPQWQLTYSCLSSIGCALSVSTSESRWWWWGGWWGVEDRWCLWWLSSSHIPTCGLCSIHFVFFPAIWSWGLVDWLVFSPQWLSLFRWSFIWVCPSSSSSLSS